MKRHKLVTSILAGVLVASALVVAGCTPKEGKPVDNAGEGSSVVDENDVQGTNDTDNVAESSPESTTDESTTEVSESDNSTEEASTEEQSTEQTESLPDEGSTENSTEVEDETLEREPNTVEDIESEQEIPSEEEVITDTTENNEVLSPSDFLPPKDDNVYPVLYYGCPNSKRVAKLVTKKAIKVVRG